MAPEAKQSGIYVIVCALFSLSLPEITSDEISLDRPLSFASILVDSDRDREIETETETERDTDTKTQRLRETQRDRERYQSA